MHKIGRLKNTFASAARMCNGNWVIEWPMYQTRKHIILWSYYSRLTNWSEKECEKNFFLSLQLSSSHAFAPKYTHTHTHTWRNTEKPTKWQKGKKTYNLNSEKQTNANNKRSATKMLDSKKEIKKTHQSTCKRSTPCLIL